MDSINGIDPTLADTMAASADTAVASAGYQLLRAADPAANNGRKEVLFLDSGVSGLSALLEECKAGIEVVLLDGTADGLSQMAAWAQSHVGYDAIHVISHGAQGSVRLGALTLDQATATARAADLAAVGAALTAQGDLLLYGCEVAKGEGRAFLDHLAALTGADVAGSDDLTGASALGGNWVLEAATGPMETANAVSGNGQDNYSGVLSTTVSSGSTETGTTSTLQGDIINDGTVVFDQDTDGTYAGAMSGSGSLTKLGTGIVKLSGVNSYSGGTTVSAGTLTGTTSSLQGAITNNAAVAFDQSTSGTYAGVMSGSGSLTKRGTGTVTLSGANSYAGTTTVSAGTLSVTGDGNLGAGAVTLSGGHLTVTGDGTIDNAIVLAQAATLTTSNSGTVVTLSGTISGSGTLTKAGSGTLVLSGTANSAAAWDTKVTSGTLQVTSDANLGSGTLTFSGGFFKISATTTIDNAIVLGVAATPITVDSGVTATLSGVISQSGGSQAVNKSGSGTLVLTGANSYTGYTNLNSGTLRVAATGVLHASSTINYNQNGSLEITGTGTFVNAFSVKSAGALINEQDVTLSGLITNTAAGARALTKSGAGTLTLTNSGNAVASAASSGTVGLTISAGTVSVAGDDQLLAGTVTLGGGTLAVTGTGAVTIDNAFALSTGGGTVSYANTGAGDSLALSGAITGTGALTKAGAGSVTLSGVNTYSGGTTVSAGTLAGTTSSLQRAITNNGTVVFDQSTDGTYAGAMSGSGALTKLGTGTVTLSGANSYSGGTTVSAGTLTGTTSSLQGAITNNAAVVFDQSTDGTYAGAMSGTGTLTKLGAGTVTLSGVSTLSGATAVSAGTLLVTGSLNGGGTISIASGATLGGTGSLAGAVTVGSGGIIAAGTGVGTLVLGNGLTIASGGTLSAEIAGSTPGTGYDQIVVTGAVNVGGATLSATLGNFAPVAGNSFILISNDGNDGVVGTFSGLAEGSTVTLGGRDFQISYVGGDGNDISLTAAAVVNSPPVNSAVPTVTGTALVGNDLSASTGTWTDADGDALSYSYQWYRADDTNGTNATLITNATSAAYTLTPSDAHKYLRVVVTANDGQGGTQTATAAYTAIANSPPVNTTVPTVTGTATVGNVLSATNGGWSDADSDGRSFTYQWYRADDTNGTNAMSISGATSAAYTLTTSDAHKYLRVVVTANDGKGGTQTASAAYTAINNSAPVNSAVPTVTGTATVGSTLSATNGSWSDADGDTQTYSYQWYRADDTNGTNAMSIGNATSAAYTLTASDAHKYLRVVVTANDGKGGTQTATAAYTAINNSPPVNTAVPTVTGTATVGNALSTSKGSWSDADGDGRSYTYQWYRADDANGTNLALISGATSDAYTLTTSDAHKYLRVAVTVNDGRGGTQTATAAYTAINNSVPVNSAVPTVTGTATVGNTLSATKGSWSDADGDTQTYSYQWYRADDTNGTNATSISGATSSSYSLTTSDAHKYLRVVVTANDGKGGTQTASAAYTAINNSGPSLNTPAAIGLTDTSAPDQFGAQTGTLSASDADGDSLTFSLSGSQAVSYASGGVTYDLAKTGTYGTLYLQSGTGAYLYEPDAAAINALSAAASEAFTVGVSDGAASGSSTLTVNLTGANDTPTDLALSATTVALSAAGANSTVATLSATDADAAQTHGFTLVSGAGSTDNALFTIDGAALKVGSGALAAGTYSVRLRATDNGAGALGYEKAFTITVGDDVPPTVTAVQVPASGAYRASQPLEFTVTFSEAVTVDTSGGTPRLALTVGGATRYATYQAGSGTTALTFRYTVAPGDTDADGITVDSLSASGGTLRDAAGNDANVTLNTVGSTSGILVDTTAPTLAIAAISTDDRLNASEAGTALTITGTASGADGQTVRVGLNGQTYTGTITNGAWSVTVANTVLGDLADQAYTVTADVADTAGNDATQATRTVVVDKIAPTAAITSSALSNSAAPILAGTAEAGTTVTVSVAGATYTAVAAIDGRWLVDLATAVPAAGTLALNTNGTNSVSVQSTDAAGNVSPTASQTLTLDTTVPGTPTVTSAALTNVAKPTVAGTAEAGSAVTVTVAGATYATAADGNGAWSIDLATATPSAGTLALDSNGANAVSVTARDAAGNTSAPVTQTLVIDTTAPTATVLFEDDSIDAIEQSSTGFLITGGEAGAAFTWTITSSGGGQVSGSGVMTAATARVDGLNLSGLGDGTLSVALSLTDAVGNISQPLVATTQKLTATVDKPAPIAPPAEQTVDGAKVGGSITVGANGSRTTTVRIEAPTAGRQEDSSTPNSDLADVPVVQEQVVDARTGAVSTVATLTVSVQTGVAATATGSAERQTAADSLAGLIAAIEERTDAGSSSRTGLTSGGTGFLSALSSQAQLLVRSIDFSTPDGTAGQSVQTRVTGGAPGGNGQSSTTPTALVLNTTGVNAPMTIQLDNVQFAAVIGNATLVGGDGEQVVYGDAGRQWLYLGAGDDELHGGAGDDTVASAGGNDTLFGDDGDDLMSGGEGDDLMSGGADQDTMFGGVGNDTLGGGSGADLMSGDDGDDVLFGEDGNDTLFGGAGADTLAGGAGDDVLAGGAGGDALFGGDGNDTLFGQEGDDILSLGAGNDIADGGDGNDTLFGEGGDDTLFGGAGADILSLGAGNDLGSGGDGNDTLFGDDGDDTLFGGAGDDALAGGAGNDLIFLDGGADTVWGGAGADVFAFGGGSGGSVVMDFTAGTDRLALFDATIDLKSVVASARVVNGSTVLDLKQGVSVTIFGQTGDAARWFA